jgi:hypothetical protein
MVDGFTDMFVVILAGFGLPPCLASELGALDTRLLFDELADSKLQPTACDDEIFLKTSIPHGTWERRPSRSETGWKRPKAPPLTGDTRSVPLY